MREGALFGTVQTERVQAGQGRKERPLSAFVGGGKDTGNEGARVLLDGEGKKDEITGWSGERKRFGKEHLSIWSKLKRRRDSGGEEEWMRGSIEEVPATSVPVGTTMKLALDRPHTIYVHTKPRAPRCK